MLVFAGIAPHPPIIIPTIGKDNISKVAATIDALKSMEKDLYAAEPDVIVIVSPHSPINPDAFMMNLGSKYTADFEEFGDFETKLEFASSPMLSLRIQERVEDDPDVPMYMQTIDKLDHGIGVPLYYLTSKLKKIKVIPLSISLLSFEKHVQFGRDVKDEISQDNRRIAFIASGDLSHRTKKSAPAGFAPEGEKFDKELIEKLKNKDLDGILKMDPAFIDKAGECGLRSILIMLGVIDHYNYDPEILSYEDPFGVGYLVANMRLK